MTHLIEDALSVSRSHKRPLNLTHFSTIDLVNCVLADLEGLIAKAKARIITDPKLPAVNADREALHRLFLNLISNALKYVGNRPQPEVRIGCTARPDDYEFFVQDNGIGIPQEYHQRIFQLFWRAPDANAPGAGVGLSTVKAVVLRHGGRIWVESQPGDGATFRFTIPRKEAGFGSRRADPDADTT
jgi:signal transduction histidine kinase